MKTFPLGPEAVPEPWRTSVPSTTAAGDGVGRVLVLAGGDLPRPVLPGDVAAQHPAVGQALVEGERSALVLLLAVAVGQRKPLRVVTPGRSS